MDTGSLGDGLDQVRFSDTALADQDEVVVSSDKGGGGQLFDLDAVDGLAIELPVELAERFALVQSGLADAIGDAAFATLGGLFAEQAM